jgi:D-alanyl-D-alanine carboxypeptidase
MIKNLKFLFFGIFIGGFTTFSFNFSQLELENFFVAQITKPLDEINIVKVKKIKPPPLDIEAKAVMSLKLNQKKKIKERILFAKNENQILPIASLTKLMTALIVIENPQNYPFEEKIKISKEASLQENVPGYGNLRVGEERTIEELLTLMLLFSSNDAAFALSQQIGVANFVNKMNEKAKEIGLDNTYFINPTGLDPDNLIWSFENKDYFNYSTAKDLILLGKYILENYPIVFEFSNNKHEIKLLDGQKLIGMKTGYTPQAGGCLLLIFADENDNYFINVILGTKTKEERFLQMQKLIDWINAKP